MIKHDSLEHLTSAPSQIQQVETVHSPNSKSPSTKEER